MAYAENTYLSVGRSKADIEDLLNRNKATRFYTGQEQGRAVVGFEMQDRRVQFELQLPELANFAFKIDGRNGEKRERTPESAFRDWEQACRARWRALLLAIKSKLVSVEAGIESFEEAFLAQIVLPGQGRIGDMVIPQLADVYAGKKLPPLLPGRGK